MILFALFVVVFVIIVLTLWFYCKPLNYVVRLGEIGFVIDTSKPGKTYRERQIERVKRLRHVGELPPVYPNGVFLIQGHYSALFISRARTGFIGWFCIAESRDIKPGEIKGVVVFGEQLSLIRAEDGDIFLTDSYCPHIGANLNVVNNNCVQCPFHGWIFSAKTGKCVRIPYDSRPIVEQAKIATWPIIEKNKHIYVWHHCDGLEPDWDLPNIDEVENGEWTYKGRTEHEVCTLLVDSASGDVSLPGNTGEWRRFGTPGLFASARNDVMKLDLPNPDPWFQHLWEGGWEPRTGDEAHISVMTLQQIMLFCRNKIPLTGSFLKAYQIGPGAVYMHFDFGFWGKAIVFHHVTPEEPLLQFERDVFIWSNKKFLRTPLLCKNDGPIQKHRRWFNQFYTEASPKLLPNGEVTGRAKTCLDW